MEQVPALHIDGNILVESLNIMHYLEETRPQRSLVPQDIMKRAKVYMYNFTKTTKQPYLLFIFKIRHINIFNIWCIDVSTTNFTFNLFKKLIYFRFVKFVK